MTEASRENRNRPATLAPLDNHALKTQRNSIPPSRICNVWCPPRGQNPAHPDCLPWV